MSNQHEQQQNDWVHRGILSVSFVILMVHAYFFCFDSLETRGYTWTIVNNFLLKVNRQSHLFTNTLYTKLICLGLLGLYGWANKPKKDLTTTWTTVWANGLPGLVLFLSNFFLLRVSSVPVDTRNTLYLVTTLAGFILLLSAVSLARRILGFNLRDDPYNEVNEQFMHQEEKLENKDSVNIPISYIYGKQQRTGWVNIINPYRATMIVGTPGSGKSFAVLNNFIRQHIEKGFSMMVYDIKYPTLTKIAYTYYLKNKDKYPELNKNKKTGELGATPMFCNVNFDKPRESLRINPLLPTKMTDIQDALEAAKIIMYNINRDWIGKSGDYFADSAINFLTSVIWYLKRYDDRMLQEANQKGVEHDGRFYCTLPHVIELIATVKEQLFPILQSEEDIELLLSPFASALLKGANNQLEGQISSALIALGRVASPALYWVLTGNDFSLDINNPKEPKILCLGNNQERKDTQGIIIGLINSRMVKLINKEGQLKCSIIVDELPTIYLMGLDNLIATARSNKISTCLGIQDYTQIKKMYGDKEAAAIWTIIGNIFSGQVVGETAKDLSSRFGKIRQQSRSVSINERDTNISLSERMEPLIPESKISSLSQGSFVGSVADNFDQKVKLKTFNGELVVEPAMIDQLTKLTPIPERPEMAKYTDEELNKLVADNFKRVKKEIKKLVASELNRLNNDPSYQHLVTQYQEAQED
ncbi:YWFCY domain-containing protein [Spirosoma endbachense]|uniref:Type IV secretion system DNA-binding domain-containing protein n=1 Tax=Spirosoma endbachense TaxID=2666025 RepID=A0A6P1VSD7_9BACT|nr:YWFCY domain-containing protein [Spirosoma endbachense]QHV95605.1 type IV secretion system DNA-binding domain-containing protein [Spirosoma endbachense]